MSLNGYDGIDGFLGTRATLMMDVLVLVMVAALAVLAWSIYQVRHRRRFGFHKTVQIGLGVTLLVLVVLFEIDIRVNGWQDRAAGMTGGEVATSVWIALWAHLVFAIGTVLLWPVVIVRAIRNFGVPPRPGRHSAWHIRWARAATIGLVMTSVTSWVFYVVAFV